MVFRIGFRWWLGYILGLSHDSKKLGNVLCLLRGCVCMVEWGSASMFMVLFAGTERVCPAAWIVCPRAFWFWKASFYKANKHYFIFYHLLFMLPLSSEPLVCFSWDGWSCELQQRVAQQASYPVLTWVYANTLKPRWICHKILSE